jgi:hypothetical protein
MSENWLETSQPEINQATGPSVNLVGMPVRAVPIDTAPDDIPPGYRLISLEEEIERLFFLHRTNVAGFENASHLVSAVKFIIERRGGVWPKGEV